ncbi:MAG: hypothetical protein SFU91_00375 [Chloroherpetonaceae bacterium]|nr:hypothetical protein [Chloroherpetonaceae bacterium]
MTWTAWIPNFENESLTLRQVYASLPGFEQSEISPLVRALENPQSPFSLTGAVDLFGHDCIHILLGRGLMAQDEAFTIGFTMGTSKSLSRLEQNLFKFATRFLYPKEYRFSQDDLKVFDLGVQAGKKSGAMEIYKVNFIPFLDEPIWKIRRALGIQTSQLREFYAEEARLLPESEVSKRLPKPKAQRTSIMALPSFHRLGNRKARPFERVTFA